MANLQIIKTDTGHLVFGHWSGYLTDVIAIESFTYIIIVKDWVDFRRFQGIFISYSCVLIEKNTEIIFKVYNYDFSEDFEVSVKEIHALTG